MKYVLVYIILSGTEPISVNAMGPMKTLNSMEECFFAREKLSTTVGGGEGYFPYGSQAVCIPLKQETK